MPIVKFEFDPESDPTFQEGGFTFPGATFPFDATISSIQAKCTNSGKICKIRVGKKLVDDFIAENELEQEPAMVWTAEYGGYTDKTSTGLLTNWHRLDDYDEGSTQTTGSYKPLWQDNQVNGFPAIRCVVLDHVIFDTPISLRSNHAWTIFINFGNYTPSLYGCCLGSRNNSGTSILSAYHWAGIWAKLRHDAGGEFQVNANTGTSGQYFGGVNSTHILRCDGSNVVSIRVNGQYTGSSTVTSGSQYNFDRIAYYKTTSTQRYGNFNLTDIMVWDDYEFTDSECEDLEGGFTSKYNSRSKLSSSHPWASGSSKTSTDAYNTPKTASSTAKTSSLLNSLTTSDQNLTLISGESSISAGDHICVFLDDYNDCGTIVVTVNYTED